MGFVASQISNMMINKIKQNNPKVTPYLNEIQGGANPSNVLRKAIQNGAITKQQWIQAKPMLQRFGSGLGVNVSQDDLNALDKEFNTNNNKVINNSNQKQNNGGFRF